MAFSSSRRPLGRAPPPLVHGASDMTHGTQRREDDGGVASALGNWEVADTSAWRPATAASTASTATRRSAVSRGSDGAPALGTVRPSMRDNPLLAKPALGQTRRAPVDRRAHRIVHGIVSQSNGSVSEAMMGTAQRPKTAPAAGRSATPNFVKMNAASASFGMKTGRDVAAFRATVKGTPMRYAVNSGRRDRSQTLPPEGFVYGKASAPDHPVSEIITNSYGRKWVEDKHAAKRREASRRKSAPKSTATRTTVLRAKVPEPEPGPLWHLPKYRNVPAATQSWRSEADRTRAMANTAAF